MADQDWKTGGLNRQKYVVMKPCPTCDGVAPGDAIGLRCVECAGLGAVRPSDPDAQYFVLRIDCGPNGPHDPNARAALYEYANCVYEHNRQFADEIVEWLEKTLQCHTREAAGKKGAEK